MDRVEFGESGGITEVAGEKNSGGPSAAFDAGSSGGCRLVSWGKNQTEAPMARKFAFPVSVFSACADDVCSFCKESSIALT